MSKITSYLHYDVDIQSRSQNNTTKFSLPSLWRLRDDFRRVFVKWDKFVDSDEIFNYKEELIMDWTRLYFWLWTSLRFTKNRTRVFDDILCFVICFNLTIQCCSEFIKAPCDIFMSVDEKQTENLIEDRWENPSNNVDSKSWLNDIFIHTGLKRNLIEINNEDSVTSSYCAKI